jgi:hypothetical protein
VTPKARGLPLQRVAEPRAQRCEAADKAEPAPAQIPGARISVCHGVGGMFAASGTIIMSNEAP